MIGGADQTSDGCIDGIDGIACCKSLIGICGAVGCVRPSFKVGVQIRCHRGICIFSVTQKGPLFFGVLNDSLIIDTGAGLGALTASNKIGDSQTNQKSHHRNNDHDFDQREAF